MIFTDEQAENYCDKMDDCVSCPVFIFDLERRTNEDFKNNVPCYKNLSGRNLEEEECSGV